MTITIRIFVRGRDGSIETASAEEYTPDTFGGCIPSIGDEILDPATAGGADRNELRNRVMWTVVRRVFNPMDNHDYVSLVVETRVANQNDSAFAVC